MTDVRPGRRLETPPPGELPDVELHDGDFWRTREEPWVSMAARSPTNLTGGAWRFYLDGFGIGLLVHHTVREHEDGTISVRAGDGSSNSVLVRRGDGKAWHGYVERGVFGGQIEDRPPWP